MVEFRGGGSRRGVSESFAIGERDGGESCSPLGRGSYMVERVADAYAGDVVACRGDYTNHPDANVVMEIDEDAVKSRRTRIAPADPPVVMQFTWRTMRLL